MSAPLHPDALNASDPVGFAAALAPLFEGAPSFLARLGADRPHADWTSLFARGRSIAHEMTLSDQIELIDAHPRLGADPAMMSSMSVREQGHDREIAVRARPEAQAERDRVAAELERLNAAYEARFGFRYCVHVAGRSRAELLPDMEASLRADPEAERHRALDAVVDIAMDRLSAMLGSTS